jgi:DNA-binding response OmpR family regulator
MKLRILLVDDADFIRDLIKRTLRKFLPSCEIVEAADGKRAQSMLKKQEFDLVLSDWEMPELSGEELLIWVRGEEKLAQLPFIMITSLGSKKNIIRAVECGVSDYLGKPFTAEELMTKVQKALVKAGRLKAPKAAAPQAGGGVFSSVEIFSSKGDSGVGGSADALTSGEKKPSKMKGTGVIKFPNGQVKCMVRTINNDEMVVVAKASSAMPNILSDVTADISSGNDNGSTVTGIDGFIYSLTAMEKKPSSEFFTMHIRFSTSDKHTREQVAQFLLNSE